MDGRQAAWTAQPDESGVLPWVVGAAAAASQHLRQHCRGAAEGWRCQHGFRWMQAHGGIGGMALGLPLRQEVGHT